MLCIVVVTCFVKLMGKGFRNLGFESIFLVSNFKLESNQNGIFIVKHDQYT